jgi:hypothetical protein
MAHSPFQGLSRCLFNLSQKLSQIRSDTFLTDFNSAKSKFKSYIITTSSFVALVTYELSERENDRRD